MPSSLGLYLNKIRYTSATDYTVIYRLGGVIKGDVWGG